MAFLARLTANEWDEIKRIQLSPFVAASLKAKHSVGTLLFEYFFLYAVLNVKPTERQHGVFILETG
jgi:hypothetical protein